MCVDVLTDFAAARSRWEAIEAQGGATPFQSFAWVSTLVGTVGRSCSAEFFALFVREIASGRDLMLLPLVRRSLGPIRIVECPDFGVSDYGAPILAPGLGLTHDRFLAIWKLAIAAVPASDVIRINNAPQHVDGQTNSLLRLAGLQPKESQSWSVALPELWSAYETQVLAAKFRRNIRRSLKRLGAAGTVEYLVASKSADVDEIFTELCMQRRLRFNRVGRFNILDNPAYQDFYRQMIHKGLASGFASVSALKVEGQIVATILGLHWRGIYFALIPTMTETALQAHGLGKVMSWFQVKEMHARGCRRFDFTIGNEPYKRDFGATPSKLYELAQPLRLRGVPLAWALGLRRRVKRFREPPT